jgi:hypothetical protein
MNKFFGFIFVFFGSSLVAQEAHHYPENAVQKRRLIVESKQGNYSLTADIVDGKVFIGGDICVGTAADVFGRDKGGVIALSGFSMWPNSEIPYIIESGHAYTALIEDAIEEYNTKTNICLYPRTTETNYVKFIEGSGCWSWVGRVTTGEQEISIGIGCWPHGTIMHEINHAAGMWHEQSRSDRDTYVTILTANITPDYESNFDIYYTGSDVGSYDYTSVMHYSRYAFSSNGSPTISINMPPGTPSTTIGQRDSLSSTDIFTLNTMYPTPGCPTTNFSLTAANYGFSEITSRVFQDCGNLEAEIPVKTGDSVTFKAATTITLHPGFEVRAGSSFTASIESCPVTDEGVGRETTDEGLPRIKMYENQQATKWPPEKIKIYPNPFQQSFNIETVDVDQQIIGWQIFDLSGKMIQSGNQSSKDLGSQLQPGVYFLHLISTTKEGVVNNHIEKIIKH